MKFTTLIPLQRNDGSKVSRKEMRQLVGRLLATFGGLTEEGVTTGEWLSPTTGKQYRDECLKVFAVCDNSRLDEARELVREIGRQLGQEVMFFEVQYYDGPQFLDC